MQSIRSIGMGKESVAERAKPKTRGDAVPISVSGFKELSAKSMSERMLSQLVVDCARALGYMAYRTHNSQHSPAGFPDIVAVRGNPPRIIVAELKREGQIPTPVQFEWLNALVEAGLDGVYVWTPADWMNGTIEAVLRERS